MSPWGFLFDCIERPHWDFPIRLCHFGVSGSFMMKRMSFKRMIHSSYIVEPCSTIYKIDLPKNKAFFE
jgi:hypothetical protein